MTRLIRAAALLAVMLATTVSRQAPAQSASNGFWQAQSIYQVITDRFFDGNTANNNAEGNYNAADPWSVHGGDFKGLEQKLDYIKALGATAIWISPVVLNASGQFHGYAGRDFYSVAPHWGTMADLQHFTQAAHARGLLVIDDIIVNHGGDMVYSTDGGYANFVAPPGGYNLRYRSSARYAAPFNTNALNPSLTNLFHNNGAIPDYNTAQHMELGELSGLDDFRTESPYVRSNMAAIYRFWIEQAGFDGFRIDTAKHVEMGFWQEWCPAIHTFAASLGKSNFFLFGEVYDGSESKCGSYTGTKSGGAYAMDSVVDYPLYFAANSVFANASGNTRQIETHYNNLVANYDADAQMRLVTFLDNHDQARFLSAASNNTNRLKTALAFLYTSRGIPCLYYGTEQAFNGGNDPYDREDMFDGQFEQGPSLGDNFNMTHPLFLQVAQLNNFRRLYPALLLGTHANLWNNATGPGLLAYARRLPGEEVFVVLNTAASTQVLTNRPTQFPPGTEILNLLDTNEVLTVTAKPEIPPVTVPSMTAKIFVARTNWKALDPVVASNSPAHDAAAVPTWSPIVLQFNQPMDTNSVQDAFTVSPPVAGAFSWSAARDTLTFTPAGAGLTGLATITVRLTNSATSGLSTNRLFAPYELKLKTAATSYPDSIPPSLAIASPTNAARLAGMILVSGTASDNTGVQRVEVRLDDGPWLAASGTNSWSFGINSSNCLNGPHSINARAADAAGNFSATSSVAVVFYNLPGEYLRRVSCGNAASAIDCSSNTWAADRAWSWGGFGYSGGTSGYMANSITGVCASAQSIYQRERYSTGSGGFLYLFDCPAGIYETTLLEAETYWSGPGQRVFNIFIQNQPARTNLDLCAAAGGNNRPLTLVFTNAVTNAQLQLWFQPLVDNARSSGIQVRKIAEVFSDTDGIPDWWRLGWFGHPLGDAADQSRADDDADRDGASNLTEYRSGTDPLSAASKPPAPQAAIQGVSLRGADVVVTCDATTNWSYQLQRRAEIGVAPWNDAGATAVASNGTATLTDLGGGTNPVGFYRVKVR